MFSGKSEKKSNEVQQTLLPEHLLSSNASSTLSSSIAGSEEKSDKTLQFILGNSFKKIDSVIKSINLIVEECKKETLHVSVAWTEFDNALNNTFLLLMQTFNTQTILDIIDKTEEILNKLDDSTLTLKSFKTYLLHKIYFFGCYALSFTAKGFDNSIVSKYYAKLHALIEETHYSEPKIINLETVNSILNREKFHENSIKECKDLSSYRLLDLEKAISFALFIQSLLFENPNNTDYSIIQLTEHLFKGLEQGISSAAQQGIKNNYLDFFELNNIRLKHYLLYCFRTIMVPLQYSQVITPELRSKALTSIDMIKKIQAHANNEYQIFYSILTQAEIYFLLYDIENPSYLNLGLETFKSSSQYIVSPELLYLTQLSASLLQFTNTPILFPNDKILEIFQDPFPGISTYKHHNKAPIIYLVQLKINYIQTKGNAIAARFAGAENSLFVYKFLGKLLTKLNEILIHLERAISIDHILFLIKNSLSATVMYRIKAAENLNMSTDMMEDLLLIKKYAPEEFTNVSQRINQLTKKPSIPLVASGSVEMKEAATSFTALESKTEEAFEPLTLSEIEAIVHQLCGMKEDKPQQLSLDSPVYKLTFHFLSRFNQKQYEQYSAADDEAKKIIQIIQASYAGPMKKHNPTRRLYSQANKIRIWSYLFRKNVDFDMINSFLTKAKNFELPKNGIDPFTKHKFLSDLLLDLKAAQDDIAKVGYTNILNSVDNPFGLQVFLSRCLFHFILLLPPREDFFLIKNAILSLLKDLETTKKYLNLQSTLNPHGNAISKVAVLNRQLFYIHLHYHDILIKQIKLFPNEKHFKNEFFSNCLGITTLYKELPPHTKKIQLSILLHIDIDCSIYNYGKNIKELHHDIDNFKKDTLDENPIIASFAAFNLTRLQLMQSAEEEYSAFIHQDFDSYFSALKLNKLKLTPLLQASDELAQNVVFYLMINSFMHIQNILLNNIRHSKLPFTITEYSALAQLINASTRLIKDLDELNKPSVSNQHDFFKNLISAVELRITIGKALGKSTEKELNLLTKICKPDFLGIEFFANDLNINFAIEKEMKAAEPAKESMPKLPSALKESSQLDQTEVETKDSPDSKSNHSTSAQPKERTKDQAEAKKTAVQKIDQANELIKEDKEDKDYRSVIFSLEEAQKVLSSRTYRDTATRLLKIESAILLAHCYTETEDFKSAEIQARGARDTLIAITDSTVTGPAVNYLNALLFSLPDYYHQLAINQISDLTDYSFSKEKFTDANQKTTDLISLAENAIRKIIQKVTALKQPKSSSSILPTTAVLDPFSTSSSSSIAAKPEQKKQEAKLANQHQASYTAKVKPKEQTQKTQSSSSSSSAAVNQALQKKSIVSFPSGPVDSAPKPKAEDKKQEVAPSSNRSQENKSSHQSGNSLAAFSITTEQSKALSDNTKVNEEKTEFKGYKPPKGVLLSEAIQAYLKRYENEFTIRQQIENLNLSEAECEIFKKELAQFYDPIEMDHIRMPILINGHSFDLDSMLGLPLEIEDKPGKPVKRSPLSGLPQRKINGSLFTLETLQPNWRLQDEIKLFVKKVEEYRIANKAAATSAEPKPEFTFSLASYSDYY